MPNLWDTLWDGFWYPFGRKPSQDDFVLEPPNGYSDSDKEKLERYLVLWEHGKVPMVKAWVKRNPDLTWTIFLGQTYHPQACLKKTYHDHGYAVVMARFWVEKWRMRHVDFYREIQRRK